MGKSPGKWIKTVLFGKKPSKSSFSTNVTPDKKASAKAPAEDLSQNTPIISDPYQSTDRGVDAMELEKETIGSTRDVIASSPMYQGSDSKSEKGSAQVVDADMRSQDLVAAKVQAAFRGYLARRAFRALKGIIRLQALIRGHLVRRQAVATLHCMKAIVRFQALVRGYKDATRINIGANSFPGSGKLSKNTFVRKLLVRMPDAVPLSLQYDVSEPNSAWTWLERWTVTRFWDPPARAKRITKSKPQRKQPGMQISETEAGKSKRAIRKVPTSVTLENDTLASETDNRPRRNLGKPTVLAPEEAQSELERVKRNLRKVSSLSSSTQVVDKSEPEFEKIQSVEIAKLPPPPDVPDLEIAIPSRNNSLADPDAVVDAADFRETLLKNEPVDAPNDTYTIIETLPIENDVKTEGALNLDDELSIKGEKSNKDNLKAKKRRSLPAKQEFAEKVLQNNLPSLPSYMAATESAKAKLRGQCSSKFVEDGAEFGSNNARRHSLPASTNGKLSTLSPRVQKPTQANGKGGSKTNAAFASSKDDKAVQPGWRR